MSESQYDDAAAEAKLCGCDWLVRYDGIAPTGGVGAVRSRKKRSAAKRARDEMVSMMMRYLLLNGGVKDRGYLKDETSVSQHCYRYSYLNESW